jgi:membrane protease YdiL (CAAX protease family)
MTKRQHKEKDAASGQSSTAAEMSAARQAFEALLIWAVYHFVLIKGLTKLAMNIPALQQVTGLSADALADLALPVALIMTLFMVRFYLRQRLHTSYSEIIGLKKWNFAGRTYPLGIVILACVVLWIIVEGLSSALGDLVGDSGEESRFLKSMMSDPVAKWSIGFTSITLAPLVEESIYRGLLYSAFERLRGVVFSVIIVSLLFAGVHMYQNTGVSGLTLWDVMLPQMARSLGYTIARAASGRLLPSIVVHTLHNLWAFIIILTKR